MRTPKNIISIDAEASELGGEIFAIGAVVFKQKSGRSPVRVAANYCGVTDPPPHVDPWVKENVLPVLPPKNLHNQTTLLSDFWLWLAPHLQGNLVLVDVGFPVEARLFSELIRVEPSRAWKIEGPVLDLASELVGCGLDGFNTPRVPLAQETFGPELWKPHHPMHDAVVQAGAHYSLVRKYENLYNSPTLYRSE